MDGKSDTIVTIIVHDVRDRLPSCGDHVLAFYNNTVDRAALYGEVWRRAEYGEDQIYGVTHWADLPDVITWGSSVCMLCAQHFDYIKQDRMPVPKVCKRCDP